MGGRDSTTPQARTESVFAGGGGGGETPLDLTRSLSVSSGREPSGGEGEKGPAGAGGHTSSPPPCRVGDETLRTLGLQSAAGNLLTYRPARLAN